MINSPKLLIAASASIPEAVVRYQLQNIPNNLEGQITFLEGNPGLRNYVREQSPQAVGVSAKTLASFKKIIAAHDYLVLLWDGEDLTRLLFEGRLAKKKIKLVDVPVTRVVNKKLTSDYDIYIGRGSPWGNPFAIGHGEEGPSRAEVINLYRQYFEEKIKTDPAFKTGILAMKGLRLACFCKPEACHGDVIAEYLDRLPESKQGKASGISE
jgi:hypothetical protein